MKLLTDEGTVSSQKQKRPAKSQIKTGGTQGKDKLAGIYPS